MKTFRPTIKTTGRQVGGFLCPQREVFHKNKIVLPVGNLPFPIINQYSSPGIIGVAIVYVGINS
jgi:hypothetical protein